MPEGMRLQQKILTRLERIQCVRKSHFATLSLKNAQKKTAADSVRNQAAVQKEER